MVDVPAETVVVIHGLWMNGAEAGLLRHRLSDEHGYPTELFQYGTFDADFNTNADRLRDFLDELESPTLHLVGHSTGGADGAGRPATPAARQARAHRLPRLTAPGQHRLPTSSPSSVTSVRRCSARPVAQALLGQLLQALRAASVRSA